MISVKYEIRQDETNHVDSTFERTFADTAEQRAWELTQSQHPFLHLHTVSSGELSDAQAQARNDALALVGTAPRSGAAPDSQPKADGWRGPDDGKAHKVDLSAPVTFYDDRSKTNEVLHLTEVLFVKGAMVLCEARFPGDDALYTVLFDRDSREVLTDNFVFWNAENP